MASHIWIGGASAVAQIDTITIPSNVESGQVFTAKIGNKELTYTYPPGPVLADVTSAIVSKWNASTIPEFAEMTATAVLDDANNLTGEIAFTAVTAGKPFIVSFSIGDGTNEIQVITIGNNPIGGTYTLSFAGQTTGNIAHNASAATVQAALEALSNIGVGDVSVTGSDGGPYTVEFTGNLANTDVAMMTSDVTNLLGTDEQQIISLTSSTGGTFTLSYAGQMTGNIAYNASAATVETALEALSTIGTGNVSVSGANGGPYTVTFQNALGKTDVAMITVDGALLTGGLNVSVTETTPGGGGQNEIWHLSMYDSSNVSGILRIGGDASATSGTFTIQLQIDSTTVMQTGAIAYDATPAAIMAAFEATDFGKAVGGTYPLCFAVSAGSSLGSGTLADGNDYLLWWHPVVALNSASAGYTLTIDNTSLVGGTYGELGAGSLGQLVTESGNISFSSFYIKVGIEETDDLAWNASAATIQAALEGLSNVGSGNVQVTSSAPDDVFDPFVLKVEFIGDLANQNTGLTVDIKTHNTGIGTVKEDDFYTAIGSSGTAEVQNLSITGSPVSGTFGLSFGGVDSASIAYNASAATVQAALEAMSSIGSGNVVCTGGPLPDTAVVITFAGNLSGIDLATMTVVAITVSESVKGGNAPTVTIVTTQAPVAQATTTANSGPNNWDIAANWNTNTVPVTSDTVYISDTEISILYGLDQSAVTLAALHIEQTFSGFIGLPRTNTDGLPYFEYRDPYLKIGATTLFIGDKEGDGSDRIKIDLGSVQSTVLITDSGDGEDANTPAILLLGTHASNVININRGSLGVAYYPTEVSTIALLRQAFFDDATDDTTVFLGAGVTITDIIKSGGVSDINSNTTAFEQTAGETTIHAGAHTLLNILEGSLNYNSIGNLALANLSGGAVLNFDQDRRPKDVTLINKLSEESEIIDSSGSIIAPVIDMENIGDLSTLTLGKNFKITVGATT